MEEQKTKNVDEYVVQVMSSIPSLKVFLETKLNERASIDNEFAVTYNKTNKSIAECERYIIKQMQEIARQNKNGNVGFVSGQDEDLINIAVHYYDEDSIVCEEPKKAEPKKAEQKKTEPKKTEPKKTETKKTESKKEAKQANASAKVVQLSLFDF